MLLKQTQCPTDRSRGPLQPTSGARQASFFNRSDEDLHCIDTIHHLLLTALGAGDRAKLPVTGLLPNKQVTRDPSGPIPSYNGLPRWTAHSVQAC